ncbi:hypothetical protein CIL03_00345 [Virgibacillus indicus]|uniref:PD-(D/E)XK endonuclease-like domain-containing protein n=1 Tax=Virgibacillus indicus TaxID=2024554 RepID=A0A265NC55_9BACI|nr:hypothetical protein [Virgibacillus indicus]OZU89630.1 hypothetical protein CIL03_00345 [Virgibacillus indicus]
MQKDSQKPQVTKPYFPIKSYASLRKFLNRIEHNHKEIHIFGTSGLANLATKESRISSMSIDELFRSLFPNFRTARIQIYLQSECRKIINKGNFDNEKYLLNRLDSIVRDYYLLADLGLTKINSSFTDSRKNEVMSIINEMLKKKITMEYFYRKEEYTKTNISKKMIAHSNLQKIIFYEIEYLNFGRMNFIHWLKSKGFIVEFRIPYKIEFSNTFTFWEQVYSVVTNYSSLSSDANENFPGGNRFGFFMQNNDLPVQERNDVSILEFESPHDFANYYENNPDKFVSVDTDEVLPIIEHEKSPMYENGVGKFIYYIQFCSIEEGNLKLSFETLIELITSSWVKTKNISGQKALSLMMDLQEYMSGTSSIEEIKERLNRLVELDLISRSFDKENQEDVGRNRLKRYMLNPFRTFSFVNQDRYLITINQLIELVNIVEKKCRLLISEENDLVNVNNYFSLWKEVLGKEIDESDVKEFWNNVFNVEHPSDWEFTIHELLQLIYLNAESNFDKDTKLLSLPSIQQKIIQSSNSTKLHLTNLTQMNFPESHQAVISEIFTYTDFKNCIHSASLNTSDLLHSLWTDYEVSNNFEKLGVYQIYNVLENHQGPVIFSWIKHLQKDGFRNIFLDILADLYTDGEIVECKASNDGYKDKLKDITPNLKTTINLDGLKGKIAGLFWLDHDFCSKKFLLSTVIEQQPVYESDYHQSFLFSKIGKLFSYSKSEREEFKELVYPLFPHWTYTKKDNLIDLEYKTSLRRYKTYENISFPKEMKSLQILRSVYRENRRTKARNQYRKDKMFNDKELIKQLSENVNKYHIKAEPGNHCKMCPHLNNCTEGMYAIDNIIN